MSSITVSSLVLGSLTVEVDGADASLALSVLGTAPASLTIELGTPGAHGNAATIAVGTTTTLNPGESATVVNVGTSSAATFNFGIPKGEQGVQGIQGSPGNAATVSVGSTTTGAAGSSASVTNSGTSSAAVLQFTIPRGDTGATGATGATGPAGPGVPVGGTAGQSLLKVDGVDYNTTWGTPPLATLATSAETVIATVRNNTGATLTAGQVVYISGAAGNRAAVALAQANLEATSSGTYGMVSAPIPNNSDGTIVIAGFVANLNTSAFTDGDLLYLSPTTAGGFTSTKPTAPDNLVYIGVVARAHPNQGVIQLRISNGFELDELHDVSVPTPSNNDLLTWESSTALWKNKSAATLGLATTSASNAAYLAKASNLSDLANAGTARSNLGLGTAAVEPATKLVPAGGTTGQVLTKLSNADWDDAWATPSGGGGGINVQSFGTSTTSGTFTWTKPANAKQVEIFMWGGGGGGGSGACNTTANARAGGGAGGGATFFYTITDAAYLDATETVTVGAGGNGGGGSTGAGGIGGTIGGNTVFKIWRAVGGNLGNPGTSVGGTGGAQRTSFFFLATNTNTLGGGAQGTTSAGVAGQTNISTHYGPGGGGGGAGAAAGNTTQQNGGAGGGFSQALSNAGLNIAIAGGQGGNPATPSQPTAGTNAAAGSYNAGTGGGGGFYRTATAGSAGAAGGWPGGGGGGGGACDTGFTSGAGGAGGNGRVIIVTHT